MPFQDSPLPRHPYFYEYSMVREQLEEDRRREAEDAELDREARLAEALLPIGQRDDRRIA